MNTSLQQISKELLALPLESRAMLAEQLLDSLHEADPGKLQEYWAREAIRRRDEMRSGAVKGVPAEEVLAEARRMVGRQ